MEFDEIKENGYTGLKYDLLQTLRKLVEQKGVIRFESEEDFIYIIFHFKTDSSIKPSIFFQFDQVSKKAIAYSGWYENSGQIKDGITVAKIGAFYEIEPQYHELIVDLLERVYHLLVQEGKEYAPIAKLLRDMGLIEPLFNRIYNYE